MNLWRRSEHIKNLLIAYMPATVVQMHDNFVTGITKDSFGEMKPEWNIHPPLSIKTHQLVITENFIDYLKDRSIISCPGPYASIGENEVELLDGTRLAVDAVIFCTGCEANFSIMPDLDLMCATLTPENTELKAKINSGPLARLYQNIFNPRYPDSIAWLCYWSFTVGIIPIGDLMSTALAQVWKDAYKLPSQVVMNKEIDKNHAWIAKLAEKDMSMVTLCRKDLGNTSCMVLLGWAAMRT